MLPHNSHSSATHPHLHIRLQQSIQTMRFCIRCAHLSDPSWPHPCKVPYLLCMQVYEQRALPDPVHRNLDRSYHLAMSHRGMGAVEKVCSRPTWPPLRRGPFCMQSLLPISSQGRVEIQASCAAPQAA